ncbi:MAG: hypothetical protein QW051_00085 [Candidatus Aenigmatarchaeota archaeon]
MKFSILITAILVLLLFLCFSVILIANNSTKENFSKRGSQTTAELSTDKDIYHSSDEMVLNVYLKNFEETDNMIIKVYGIQDRYGNYHINQEKNVSYKDEINETFVFRLPSCYGCAGVSPGMYEIKTEFWKDNGIIFTLSKNITLEK